MISAAIDKESAYLDLEVTAESSLPQHGEGSGKLKQKMG